ncbi:MAG: tRNA preQ1(34) S-adenosylmethionine ribosyltransferase-isomerase QueA [Desulfobacterales bacterium]|nr:MAG: tRNA preQ1(34) S-adenosylmethionine ribosyltransferase-isomerase QueA [Desulfobacterales bacterium]
MYALSDYEYCLPAELIARRPAPERDASRLLRLNRETGAREHHRFSDLPDLLKPGDLLVLNDTKVIPARINGRKSTGGRVELLLLESGDTADDPMIRRSLVKASKKPKPGTVFHLPENVRAEVLSGEDMRHVLRFSGTDDLDAWLARNGEMPIPPYIRPQGDARDKTDYQTVYASRPGAVAAPTAGLHFTDALLDRLRAGGVRLARITLHVGCGTFIPVRTDDIRDHKMHSEVYDLPQDTADRINAARNGGGRIIAVGTTAVRTLEYAGRKSHFLAAESGECDLFLYPGVPFGVIDGMLTNFHLPCSTLLMLVSAFAGRERILAAYRSAVERRYRFYSYGDAMLIL